MTTKVQVVGFDADDTLWHNETLFIEAEERFASLVAEYEDSATSREKLFRTERKNLERYGYGIKSFTLSMIETAIEVTDGRIGGREIREILRWSDEMLAGPTDLLDGVEATIRALHGTYKLVVVTKGDLFDQEVKLARSGLGDFFDGLHVVTEKNRHTYERVIAQLAVPHHEFVMVGNSLKSDILPVVEIGGHGVHVPYATTWAHEDVPDSVARRYAFHRVESISAVPEVVSAIR